MEGKILVQSTEMEGKILVQSTEMEEKCSSHILKNYVVRQ